MRSYLRSASSLPMPCTRTRRKWHAESRHGGGDYLLPVKDNQSLLREDIALVFAPATTLANTITAAQTTDAHGDHIEPRRLRASTALVGYTDFSGHQQVLELRRTITNKRTAKTREELVYGITSLPAHRASAADLLNLRREH